MRSIVAAGLALAIAYYVTGTRKMLDLYAATIARFRGDIPLAVVACRIWVESRGKTTVYHGHTGEAGLLQVWPGTAKKYGAVHPTYEVEENLRVGLAFWNDRALWLKRWDPDAWPSANHEFHSAVWLVQSIGPGATTALFKRSNTRTVRALAAWVQKNESSFSAMGGSFGTQSPATVAKRIGRTVAYMNAAHEVGTTSSPGFGVPGGGPGTMSSLTALVYGVLSGAAAIGGYLLAIRLQGKSNI